MSFFIHPQFGIPLRDLREEFRLKSTYFSVKLIENNVVLTGKGFGHGVGLCQEGAMQMAKLGFTSEEILNFYYPNTTLKRQ
jgi:stage II sporulation protein D